MSLIPKNGKVAVIGAGVSGLTFSYFLLKLRPDVQISVFEKNKQPGGWISTEKLKNTKDNKDIVLEKGPRTLRGVSDGTLLIVDILRELGYGKQVEVMRSSSDANRKWLLDPGNNLVQTPNSFGSFVKFMLSDITNGMLKSVAREPFRKPPQKPIKDESIRDFFLRRFGSTSLADNVLSAVMHGVYSGDVGKLSVNATLPGLVKLEKDHGSIVKGMLQKIKSKKPPASLSTQLTQYEALIAPEAKMEALSGKLKKFPIMRLHDGLQVFPRVLSDFLQKQSNVRVHYGTAIQHANLKDELTIDGENRTFDHVRYTLSTLGLAKMIDWPELSEVLKSFEHTTIFLANIYTKKKALIPEGGSGFGFLVPIRNKNPESLLGVIYDSDCELDAVSFFDEKTMPKAPYHKITLMMGGHFFSSRGVPSNKINLGTARRVLSEILHVDLNEFHNIIVRDEASEANKEVEVGDNDLLISYNLHRDCIPQYNVGFLENVDKMKQLIEAKSKGLFSMGGTALGKLGVPDCVMNAFEDAVKLSGK